MQGRLLTALSCQQCRCEQGIELAADDLDAILQIKQIVARHARLLCPQFPVLGEHAAQLCRALDARDKAQVANGFKLRDRHQPIGVAGRADGEHQLSGGSTCLAEGQKILDRGRLAIFVRAQNRRVQRKAGKVEVVRVAAEVGGDIFRCPHQPRIGVAVVTVKMVKAALVELHDATAHGRLVATDTLACQLSFDGVLRGFVRFTREIFRRAVYERGYVSNFLKPVKFHGWALHFRFTLFGEEARLQIILLRA